MSENAVAALATDATEPRALHRKTEPSVGTVLAEQLRLVGLAMRRELIIAAVLLLVSLVIVLVVFLTGIATLVVDGAVLHVDPEGAGYFAAIVGLLFPLAVWRGEDRFGDTSLWTAPVDHRVHALARVGAGWVWLMAIGAATLCWLVLITLATDGMLGSEEVRLLITDPAGAASGLPGSTESVRWSTEWWQWTLLFTGATGGYLVSSALFLAAKRPWLWAAGAWLFLLATGVLGEEIGIGWISSIFRSLIWAVDVPLAGGEQLLTRVVTLPGGERAIGWAAMPAGWMWAAATALWFAIGGVALWLASARRGRV